MAAQVRGAAIVTGAGSGIGQACAVRLAAEGYGIVVNDISASSGASTCSEIDDQGGRCLLCEGDVGDLDLMDQVARTAVTMFGSIDVLVNNAGYGRPGSVLGTDDALLDEILRVNLKGVMHGMRAVLPVMIEQERGSIVNVASMAAFGAAADRAAYGAAKSAVLGLTRSAAVENARYGVRVNAVCPGPIHTPALERFVPDFAFYCDQLPMRRAARPEEVAAAVSFLAGDDASYVSGAALPIDGAMGARLPGPLLRPEDLVG